MKLNFFDVNFYAGRMDSRKTYNPALSQQDVLRVMDESGVDRILLWHAAQLRYEPSEGNEMVAELVKNCNRLFGCWTILPPQTGETPSMEELVTGMKENSISSLSAFPNEHNYLLNRTVFGKMLDEISERSIPLIYSVSKNDDSNYKNIYRLLQDYPGLTCIITDTGDWGQDRYYRPLLEEYSKVYLDTSVIGIYDGVIEDIVNRYGSERILFGSGFPEKTPEAAMLRVKHANISDVDKENIACKNIEGLLEGIIL